MAFRSGGGGLMLFGLPFAGFGGLFAVASLLGRVEGGPWYVMAPMGLLFMLVGLALMAYRQASEFDGRRREWRTWWGFVVPWRVRAGSFDELAQVQIRREVRRSKNSTYVVFPVRVIVGGGADVTLESSRDFLAARRAAERLAGVCGLPIYDYSGDGLKITEPADLDASLKEKAKRAERSFAIPAEPASRRCQYEVDGASVRFRLPAAGGAHVLGGLIALVLPAVFVYFFFLRPLLADDDMPAAFKMLFIAFVCFIGLLLPALFGLATVYKAVFGETEVAASPEGVTVRRRGLLGWRSQRLAADDIEEVAVRALGSEVVVVSDVQALRFGRHLGADEKQWPARVLEMILSA